MLQQLRHQLERHGVGFLVAHPHAVGRVKQRDLRRRPADGQQMLGAADVPADRPRRRPSVEAADIHVVDAADELVIDDELPVWARAAALFLPDLGMADDVGRGRGELGEIRHDARPDLVEIIHSGHADVAHVAPERAFVLDHVSAAAHHQFLVVEVNACIPCCAPGTSPP